MTQRHAFICDAIRTPFGRYGGALSSVRADDLGAIPLRALMQRNPGVDWTTVTDILFGCANQAGEDNRNVARMAGLLAGLPLEVPGATINRLCGSGLDAVGTAALRLQTLQKQMRTLDDQFRTFFDGLLTADQRRKVASIKALQQSLQLGQVLNQLQVN